MERLADAHKDGAGRVTDGVVEIECDVWGEAVTLGDVLSDADARADREAVAPPDTVAREADAAPDAETEYEKKEADAETQALKLGEREEEPEAELGAVSDAERDAERLAAGDADELTLVLPPPRVDVGNGDAERLARGLTDIDAERALVVLALAQRVPPRGLGEPLPLREGVTEMVADIEAEADALFGALGLALASAERVGELHALDDAAEEF